MELNKFVGTWVYDNGVDYFEITFSKVSHYQDAEFEYWDRLISNITYIKNGITIYDTSIYTPCTINQSCLGDPIFTTPTNANLISLMYMEPDPILEDQTGDLEIVYSSSGAIQQLDWSVSWWDNPDIVETYKIPRVMVLIKQ